MRLPGSQASPDGLGVSAGRLRLRTTRVGTFPVRRRTLCDSSALSLEQLSLRLGSAFARVFTESAGLWDNAVAGDHDDGGGPGACRADGPGSAPATPPRANAPPRNPPPA